MGNKAAVDRLDDARGSKVVARLAPGADRVPVNADERSGEPWWDRTTDPLIKSASEPPTYRIGLSATEYATTQTYRGRD